MALQCSNPDCTKNSIPGEHLCARCFKISAEVQQIKLFPKILGTLERIEIALANNNIVPTTTQRVSIDNNIKTELTENLFIPTIEVSNIEVKNSESSSKQTTTNNTRNLAKIASKLKNQQ